MKQPYAPRKYQGPFLYKYRSTEHLEWLKEILLDNKLYFPTARELNDPSEARPPLTAASLKALTTMLTHYSAAAKPFLTNRGLARDAAIIAFNAPRFGPDFLLSEITPILHSLFKRVRICSPSKRPNNPHLWSAYARNHTGYCLEFREPFFGPAWEIRYEDIALDITDEQQLNPYFLFYKTRSWRSEEEVRVIAPRDHAIIIFDPRLLTRLILGSEIASANAATMRAWAADRKPPLSVVSETGNAR
jgi:hypothetical protein